MVPVFAGGEVLGDDLADEIERLAGGFFLCGHGCPSVY
jgi:hypothetical protein